jgi:replicative DNA helicase
VNAYADWLSRMPTDDGWDAWMLEGRARGWIDAEGPRPSQEPEQGGRASRGSWCLRPLEGRRPRATFPVEGYPSWLREYVVALAEATQTPVDMAAMFALAALATVAAGRVRVEPSPGWTEGVNLFVVVAMEPGSRKSAVHREICAPIAAYERQLAGDAAPLIAAATSARRIAEASLARAEKQAGAAPDSDARRSRENEAREEAISLDAMAIPVSPRYFTGDVTPEKLASMLHEHEGRIAILSAEGGVFDTMAGRYTGGVPNLDVFLQGHAGDVIRVDRRGRPREYVADPALTLGLAVQPYVLQQLSRVTGFAGRGLLDRVLFALPAGNVGFRQVAPPPVPAPLSERYDRELRAIAESLRHTTDPLVLRLDVKATETFRAFRAALEPRRRPDADLGHIQGWASKLDGAVARIAGLIHVATLPQDDWSAPLSRTTITSAIAIAEYLIPHALAAFDEIGADPVLQGAWTVAGWLRRHGRDRFSKRQAHAALRSSFREAVELDPVLELLVEHGYIRELPAPSQGGRPSRQFEVNPLALPQNAQNAQNRAD